ncbi:neurofilament medium polypeptide-like isoform X2 [Fundulus heteroclitus]|uniref:neurofilament medium polypeptide-like isoform X2 n=1 Tax=Fundulus heteroclitus TaxID=8078 RepID=UPI00165AF874|nr:neurofilament medium polypeptide-like isoform X2 [Fundulus heteroclitus]
MAISAGEIRYVLLEWTEGEDGGAHSILPIDCVRNFSFKEFLMRTEKTEKLVEWRKGRQPWPVHRARIVEVAKFEKTLKIKLREIEMEKEDTQGQTKRPHIPNSKYSEQQGLTEKASKEKVDNQKGGASKSKHQVGEKQEGHDILSKNKQEKVAEEEEEEEGEVEGEEEEEEALHYRSSKNKRASEEEECIGDEEDIIPPSKKKTAAEVRKHLDEQMWEKRKLDQMQRNSQELRNELQTLKNENERLKDIIINHIPQIKSDLAIIAQKTGRTPVEDLDSSFLTFVQPIPERRSSTEETEPFKKSHMVTELFGETPQTASTAETSAKTQIEVIKGSGVFCQAEAWKAARLATSATAMVRNLLMGTFVLETLLKSNLNGGKPTRGDGEQLVALDQIKKAAIIGINRDCIRCYIEEVASSQPRADRHIH